MSFPRPAVECLVEPGAGDRLPGEVALRGEGRPKSASRVESVSQGRSRRRGDRRRSRAPDRLTHESQSGTTTARPRTYAVPAPEATGSKAEVDRWTPVGRRSRFDALPEESRPVVVQPGLQHGPFISNHGRVVSGDPRCGPRHAAIMRHSSDNCRARRPGGSRTGAGHMGQARSNCPPRESARMRYAPRRNLDRDRAHRLDGLRLLRPSPCPQKPRKGARGGAAGVRGGRTRRFLRHGGGAGDGGTRDRPSEAPETDTIRGPGAPRRDRRPHSHRPRCQGRPATRTRDRKAGADRRSAGAAPSPVVEVAERVRSRPPGSDLPRQARRRGLG